MMKLVFKTNWVLTDTFNVEDFNRIKGNIETIRQVSLKAYKWYGVISIDNATYDSVYLIDMMNAVESNVEMIADSTYRYTDFIPPMEQIENTTFWDFDDLNRIETNLQKTYRAIMSAIENRCGIALKLGGGTFGDRIHV